MLNEINIKLKKLKNDVSLKSTLNCDIEMLDNNLNKEENAHPKNYAEIGRQIGQVGFWIIAAQAGIALALGIPGEAVMGLVGPEFVGGTGALAFLLAAGTMTMTSAAGLAGCTSAPASVTVQSAENTGITVTSQEKIKAEPDIAEITYSVYSQAADASTCQSENQTDLDAVLALLNSMNCIAEFC